MNLRAGLIDEEFEPESSESGSVLSAAPDLVEVRRNGGVAALVGGAASAVGIAYLGRAAQTGAALDWALVLVMGLLGALHLHAFVDARTPLLVADAQGVRIRLGRAWRGMPWGALATVEHAPRRGLLRDGRLVLVPRNPDKVIGELDPSGRRQSRLSEKLYGAPFALPLGLSTRVTGVEGDLTTALRQLAGNSARVVELLPGSDDALDDVQIVEQDPSERRGLRMPDPRPFLAHAIGVVSGVFRRHGGRAASASDDGRVASASARIETTGPEPVVASATPAPLRQPRAGVRAEIKAQGTVADREAEPITGRELRRPGSVPLVEESEAWGDRVSPIARAGAPVAPIVIDEFAVEPAPDPVVGPELAASRTRLGLTVDQLAERTRIRPHVIESIEVDDFAPCGGDFYARGHLRTLARVLGVDAAPLLTAYEERYADAPINARRVFEAELATGATGGIRSTRGGPNWSVFVAAIMTLVLAWSIARLVMDTPVEIQNPAPGFASGSGPGPNYTGHPTGVVKVSLTGTGSHVKITNAEDELVFSGYVAAGDAKRIETTFPVRVQAEFPSAVKVSVNGDPRGVLGKDDATDGDTAVDRTFPLKR